MSSGAARHSSGPRLHLGCGEHRLGGWINADFAFTGAQDTLFDVRHSLPLRDGSIRFIHSEDLLEHVDLEEGRRLVAECHASMENCVPARTLNLVSGPSRTADVGSIGGGWVSGALMNRVACTLVWTLANGVARPSARVPSAVGMANRASGSPGSSAGVSGSSATVVEAPRRRVA